MWYTSLQLLELSVDVEDFFCDAWFACPSPPSKLEILVYFLVIVNR